MPKNKRVEVEEASLAPLGKWGEVVENGVKGSKVGN
jgi:hypothetical protein